MSQSIFMESSYSWLKDFDWSVRLVLSTDTISTLRKPLLMLRFEANLPDGSTKTQILELTTDELKGFLDSLKAAQKVFSDIYIVFIFV